MEKLKSADPRVIAYDAEWRLPEPAPVEAPVHGFKIQASLYRHERNRDAQKCKAAFVGIYQDGRSLMHGDLIGDMTIDEFEAIADMIRSCADQYRDLTGRNDLLSRASSKEAK